MIRNFIYIFSTIICVSTIIVGQTPVGYKFDVNGQPFDGYYDPFTYSPKEKISFAHFSDSFENGYYIDNDSNKTVGLIQYENKKIWFKKSKNDPKIKIRPGEINSLVLGVDSFFTISNFYYKNRIIMEPEPVQYITEIEDVTFVKHYHFQKTMNSSTITETYIAKSKEDNIWESFNGKSKRFKENALKYFGHIPYLAKRIENGEYDKSDALSLIKTAEYYMKFEKGEFIFFDKYWQEVRNQHKSKYYAQILNRNDSLWTLAYYSDSTKLYEIDYSSFYPHKKNGLFKSFYKNGRLRQEIKYKNNKPKQVKSFLENGSLLHAYKYRIIEYEIDEAPKPMIRYSIINDSAGPHSLDSIPIMKTTISDKQSNSTYFHTYENRKLVESYRIIDDKTIYQITDQEYYFSITKIQRKFDSFIIDKKFDRAIDENAQGTILVSFIIDPEGNVIQHQVINRIHYHLDNIVKDFVRLYFSKNAIFKTKLKPYKKGKEKLYCEVVIPFEFSIIRFYRAPANYYYDHNMFMWQQQYQQQIMQQQMQAVPKFQGGF